MSFRPDIVVTDRDSTQFNLVVEAKLGSPEIAVAEEQIKRFMFGKRCPVGMIVRQDRLFLYVDTYRAYDESSIERVGEFSLENLFDTRFYSQGTRPGTPSESAALAFRWEDEVQGWLERLAHGEGLAGLPADLREALEQHVIPVLTGADVRAAGPRWQLRESRAP